MITKEEILRVIEEANVRYIRLMFTDMSGILKNVEVPVELIDKILENKVTFDGSSIEGFVRILESDMLLYPDLNTFRVCTWEKSENGSVAAFFCDIYTPKGFPFIGDTRRVLKDSIKKMNAMGYSSFNIGFEPEFYLLKIDQNGKPLVEFPDQGSYFDLAPIDTQVDCRRAIIAELIKAGFKVEAGHHEAGPSQHEINFLYNDVLTSCDNVILFKLIVKNVAKRFNVHATFMPKPKKGIAGSGMHANLSLFKGESNAFYDKNGELELSKDCYYFIGGVLNRVQEIMAITNPTINSYKRLVSGFEAPCYVAYSDSNRSALVRIPASRGNSTRCELRSVDPTCNPYLAMALVLESGLEGIVNQMDPGKPLHEDIFAMNAKQRRSKGIYELPYNLYEACKELEKSKFAQNILGEHIYKKFMEAKAFEWNEYRTQVHQWEIDEYLERH